MVWSRDIATSLAEIAGVAPPGIGCLLAVHEASWEISYDGRTLALTVAQFRLLRELVLSANHTVRTEHLAMAMFRSSHRETERVAAHVKRLRRRLSSQGVTSYRIDTVRGVGYRLAQQN